MIKFKLSDRDSTTGVRTGVVKSSHAPFITPKRSLISTELNYKPKMRELGIDIDYPNKLFLAQIKIDAKSLWTRDNEYYNGLVKQAQRYASQISDKVAIFKPQLGVYIRERQDDGRYKQVFKSMHRIELELGDMERERVIRSVVQLADDADFDGISLPYIHPRFSLDSFNRNLKVAQSHAIRQLSSGLEVMPQLPHTDNIEDFEKALKDFQDKNSEGIVCIPNASTSRYRFTHDAVKDFSLKDKSEKIGLMSINVPRKHPSKPVSHAHYTLLQGYDLIAREIPLPFLRAGGRGSGEKEVENVDRFNYRKLSVEKFNKALFFDNSAVDTSCLPLKKYTHKELFRDAHKSNHLDVVLKVMEAFDSQKEMADCQPFITSNDFMGYVNGKEHLKNAFREDFLKRQRGLGEFFA
ncbi:MAG: hypothetical protein UY63_C0022G0004 [Parcubacteria group bacterium GW2011_GWA2_51_10]|nr:MAG: hypothetical protein UY63_C0022G0004 [Parcubacteria group bacterium GW2011_GWA2_51_10]